MKRAAVLLGIVLCAGVMCMGCTEKNYVPEGYNLVWSDEFDADGAPDPEKWDYSLGGGGWGNAELQTYTNKRDNSFVKNGILSVVAKLDGSKWTSARLKTQYKASWTYGYFEIKARLPEGVGTWPAIWMMPEFENYGGWPRSGEIDIMEHVGYDQDVIHTSLHSSAFNHKKGTQKTHYEKVADVSKKFHVYAVEWTESSIEWFVDGKSFYRVERENDVIEEWPFNKNFYMILNIAIGGSWGGQQGVDKNMSPVTMDVDYVRVYQK